MALLLESDMSNKVEPWKVHHIADELRESYAQCQTDFERSVWRVYARKDIERILDGRKPTPGERAVLDQYGLY